MPQPHRQKIEGHRSDRPQSLQTKMKSNVARETLAIDGFARAAKKLPSLNNDDNNGGANDNINRGIAYVQGQSDASVCTIRPALECMPADVLINILQYLPPSDFRRDVLAFEQTCRSFRNLLRDDDIWRKFGFSTHGDSNIHLPSVIRCTFPSPFDAFANNKGTLIISSCTI